MNAVLAPLSPSADAPARPPMRALRFLTAGSVDDGKSTLIGRLLYDSRAILADQMHGLRVRAEGSITASGGPDFDLSLLTDGLEAEREQGITIDVAYRYFATPARKFIIADAPGHEQYTRNMVTAAAGSDAAVVLVDVTKLKLDSAQGTPELLPQTRRHALLAQLLRVPHIVFAVNKIDAAADAGAAFAAVSRALQAFAQAAGFVPAGIVPVSALRGDNVTTALQAPWYHGPSLLQLLETLPGDTADLPTAGAALRLPVQYVARHDGAAGTRTNPERVFWGRIAQGEVQVGDAVQVFPSGQHANVQALRHAGRTALQLGPGQSAGLVLDRPLDISRGDWIGSAEALAPVQRFTATLAWLDTEAATPGRRYWVRHGHRWVQARITRLHHRLDIHSLQPQPADTLAVNEIGLVSVELQQALPLQPYADSREGGALIVVDPASHRTSGALLVAASPAAET